MRLTALPSDWPLPRPADWLRLVNKAMTEKEAEGVRTCMARNRPCGDEEWQQEQAERLGLVHTLLLLLAHCCCRLREGLR